jgi:hypothetical protein
MRADVDGLPATYVDRVFDVMDLYAVRQKPVKDLPAEVGDDNDMMKLSGHPTELILHELPHHTPQLMAVISAITLAHDAGAGQWL